MKMNFESKGVPLNPPPPPPPPNTHTHHPPGLTPLPESAPDNKTTKSKAISCLFPIEVIRQKAREEPLNIIRRWTGRKYEKASWSNCWSWSPLTLRVIFFVGHHWLFAFFSKSQLVKMLVLVSVDAKGQFCVGQHWLFAFFSKSQLVKMLVLVSVDAKGQFCVGQHWLFAFF